mmetsp:Transcript_23320/g.48534  ORF Transcript_23320/g.48534 Transcript_23320/m.48534 type:complete len:200 (-) Transcript_23320:610-1209(-)
MDGEWEEVLEETARTGSALTSSPGLEPPISLGPPTPTPSALERESATVRLASANASADSRARDADASPAPTPAPDTEPASTRTSSPLEPFGETTTMDPLMPTVASALEPSSPVPTLPGTPTAPVPAPAMPDGLESTAPPGCAPLVTTSWTFAPTLELLPTHRFRPSPLSPEELTEERPLPVTLPLTLTASPLLSPSLPR